MKFSKAKMLARIEKEGRMDLVNADTISIMDNLDGQEATTACWRRQVYGEPVLWCIGKDGNGTIVNEADCV